MSATTSTATPHEAMTLAQFIAARDAVRDALRKFEVVVPNCRSCSSFEVGRCKKFGQDIPADFQQTPEACAEWSYDGIPF